MRLEAHPVWGHIGNRSTNAHTSAACCFSTAWPWGTHIEMLAAATVYEVSVVYEVFIAVCAFVGFQLGPTLVVLQASTPEAEVFQIVH